MISLFLHILHRANIFDEKTNDQESLCQILRDNVQDLLKDWVVRGDIVGGSFFGAAVRFAGKAYQELRKEDEELEVIAMRHCEFCFICSLVLGEHSSYKVTT